MELVQRSIELEHASEMLHYFVHPVGILVLRHWSVDVQRAKRFIVVEYSGKRDETLDFLTEHSNHLIKTLGSQLSSGSF